eukprot:scaffold10996_cov90-Isochrysis_galbana.AAC.9
MGKGSESRRVVRHGVSRRVAARRHACTGAPPHIGPRGKRRSVSEAPNAASTQARRCAHSACQPSTLPRSCPPLRYDVGVLDEEKSDFPRTGKALH